MSYGLIWTAGKLQSPVLQIRLAVANEMTLAQRQWMLWIPLILCCEEELWLRSNYTSTTERSSVIERVNAFAEPLLHNRACWHLNVDQCWLGLALLMQIYPVWIYQYASHPWSGRGTGPSKVGQLVFQGLALFHLIGCVTLGWAQGNALALGLSTAMLLLALSPRCHLSWCLTSPGIPRPSCTTHLWCSFSSNSCELECVHWHLRSLGRTLLWGLACGSSLDYPSLLAMLVTIFRLLPVEDSLHRLDDQSIDRAAGTYGPGLVLVKAGLCQLSLIPSFQLLKTGLQDHCSSQDLPLA